jgi:hypothetical protein
MRLLKVPVALMIAMLVVADVAADQDAPGKGKKRIHAVHGKVVAVKKDADKDSGLIEIAIHHKKKGGTGPAELRYEKFKVTPDTKFEFVHREGKGQVDRKPATFADVKKGEHVAIVPMEGAKEVAQRVGILVGKKGGKSALKDSTPK